MATVRGEGVRVEILTEDGWVDLSGCTVSVEVEPPNAVDVAVLEWLAENIIYTVQIEEWKEVVETASGKTIAVEPRTEM